MARKLSDALAGFTQGGLQGAGVGAVASGGSGAIIGGVAGGLTGLVLGLVSEEDPDEALNKKLANENLQLSNQEKKMVLEQVKKQQQTRRKIGRAQTQYMNDFFSGARAASQMQGTPTSTPTTSQRLYGVQ